jgi:archaemetzincin
MSSRPIIGLVPLGSVDPVLLRRIKSTLSKVFPLPIHILPSHKLPERTYHIVRNQYNSTQILEYLLEDVPAGIWKILGVVAVDLFIPILTHVFGEAQLGGTGALVSIFRPRGDDEGFAISPYLLWRRVSKLSLHELGHTFNLGHCRQPGCVMGFSTNIEKLDQKNGAYCSYCRVLLADYFQDHGLTRLLNRSRGILEPAAPSRVEDSAHRHRR